jgi:7-cyano-7-deazaguanine synthase
MDTPRAICLVSGGMDSATCLAIARERHACYALTFDYGQRHAFELNAAREVVRRLGAAQHKIVRLDLRTFGGSALTDDVDVPKDRPLENATEIPVTYVPARNTIFLSYALAWAEVVGAWDIFIGVNAVDYSGYPDCRPEYIASFERMANLAIKAAVQGPRRISVHTPLISLTKADIIRRGIQLGVDFAWTHSCYDPTPDGKACGRCDACRIRRTGFSQAGVADPTEYVT